VRVHGASKRIVRGRHRGKPFAAVLSRAASKHRRNYLRLAGLR
jgi:hypothetical protein